MKRLKTIVYCFFCICFLLTGCERSQHFVSTKSTDLSEEEFDHIRLHQNIHEKEFTDKYGKLTDRSMDSQIYNYYSLNNVTSPFNQVC